VRSAFALRIVIGQDYARLRGTLHELGDISIDFRVKPKTVNQMSLLRPASAITTYDMYRMSFVHD
jgi:hypothetical protein